jgi:hypothetical protein
MRVKLFVVSEGWCRSWRRSPRAIATCECEVGGDVAAADALPTERRNARVRARLFTQYLPTQTSVSIGRVPDASSKIHQTYMALAEHA